MKKTRLIICLFVLLYTLLLNAQNDNIGFTELTFISTVDGENLDILTLGDGDVIENLNDNTDFLEYQELEGGIIDVKFNNPNGEILYVDLFYDLNNDGEFGEDEMLYSGSSDSNELRSTFIFKEASSPYPMRKACVTLKKSNDTIALSTVLHNTSNGGPPIVVTTIINNIQPQQPRSYCMPNTKLSKFFIHNEEEFDFVLNNVFINDDMVTVIDANREPINNALISAGDTVPFWIDMRSLPEPLSLSEEHSVRCEFNDGGSFEYKIMLACCKGEGVHPYNKPMLPYHEGIRERIVVGNMNTVERIEVKATEEVFLEASKCIVLNPGFETKTNARFEAKLSTTCPTEASRQTNDASKDKDFTPTTKRNKTGLTTKKATLDFELFPNPFEDQVNIYFEHEDATSVSLMVYNITGQKVMTIIENVVYEKGEHQLVWDTVLLPKGSYFFRLQVGNEIKVKKMVK